jgi:hypothetical protein
MALHHQLHELGARLGIGVFDDADSFRGALDDFLDEGSATTGEINLLVDTVRLGAYQRLVAMINGGADPAAAVGSAGEMLARERGSADLDGSRWACAVLGFAADKVPAREVERYEQGTLRAPGDTGAAPTAAPPVVSPTQQPTTSPPHHQYPQGHAPAPAPPTAAAGPQHSPAGYTPQQPPAARQPAGSPPGAPVGLAGAGYGARPGYPQPGAGRSGGGRPPTTQGRKSPWGLIVAALVVVLALLGGGAWFAFAGDDGSTPRTEDPTTPGPTGETSGPTSEGPSSSGPTDDVLGFEAVTARYSGVAPALGEVLFECEDAATAAGEDEHLSCEGVNGIRLELITLDSGSSLDNLRSYVVDNEIGSVYGEQNDGAYYRENPQDDGGRARLYWDHEPSLQAVRLHAPSAKELTSAFGAVDAPVAAPTQPSDEQLRNVISENLPTLTRCKRVENVDRGQLEINRCRDRGLYIYYSHYPSMKELLECRRTILGLSKDHGGTVNPWSYTGSTDVTEGRRVEWVDPEFDYAHLYWDVESCLCAAEAIALNNNQNRLYKWWLNAE